MNNQTIVNAGAKYLQKMYHFTKKYSTAQTATSVIAAPGAGKAIRVRAFLFVVDGSTGTIELNGEAGNTIGWQPANQFNALGLSSITNQVAENTAVSLTTTTGTDTVFIGVNYEIVKV